MTLLDHEKLHLAKVRALGPECAVLLKKNGTFPVTKKCDLAVFGNGVRHTEKGGTGSGEVNSRYFMNIEEALKEAGFNITSSKWLDEYDRVFERAKKQFVEQVRADAKSTGQLPFLYGMGKAMPSPEYYIPLEGEGEAALYILSRTSGEGNDRQPIKGDIYLTEAEKRDIEELNRRFKRFMLVLNVSGPVDLSPVMNVGNILLLSQLGVETGHILADVVTGAAYPSGKLGTTWAAYEDYFPMETFGDPNDTDYTEGVFVGYRYFAGEKEPLFPFGYGLGYTDFEYRVTKQEFEDNVYKLTVTVTNVGDYPGKEVISLYTSAPVGNLPKPSVELKDFKKTAELKPGESERVHLSVDIRDCASYDQDMAYLLLEPGKYQMFVGRTAMDLEGVADIEVSEETIVEIKRDLGFKPKFEDYEPEARRLPPQKKGMKHFMVEPGSIEIRYNDYHDVFEIAEEVKTLSKKELVLLNIGGFGNGSKSLAVVGNASNDVAGAAGESSSVLKDRGVGSLIMSDGPAGLRLDKDYYRDENGAKSCSGYGLPDTMLEFFSPFMQKVLKLFTGNTLPEGAEMLHQYCTAIPIGTALAQSWNPDVLYAMGDIVGSEMDIYGIDLWLAPAVNIHRSIRCGRNFEYYSEDPLLAGKMAAAITRGVQSHPGRGVTVKHFAANNQETNRYGSSSNVSERALREIYLKPFEICVKEANPVSIMSSYNLICGVHTAESRELLTNVLRHEFGFEGLVVGDWVVGGKIMYNKHDKYKPTSPGKAAQAGQDIFMPGCILDYWDMRRCLRRKLLTKNQLQINATRIINTYRKLKG